MATSAREYHQSVVHYLRKTITFADPKATEIVIGVIPANAIVSSSSLVWITTAFTAGTTIDVGGEGVPALYASALVGTAVAGLVFDDALLAAAVPVLVDRTIVARLNNAGTISAGSAEIVVAYVPAER